MRFSGMKAAAVAVAISLALISPAVAVTPKNTNPKNTSNENSTSERRFLQDDLTLISQFGGVIIGVNGPGDQFEGFAQGYNVTRSIALGYPIFGSMRDDLSLIAKFGGVITGVNGPGDQYEGFVKGFSVNRSLAAGYALPPLPKPANPKPKPETPKPTNPNPEVDDEVDQPKPETRKPGVYISPRATAITEGFSLPISVSIVEIEAAKASLFLNDGNKSFLIETKDVPRNGNLTFITPAAIGRYFVVLNTGEKSANIKFDVKPFGLTGISIMDATTPSNISVPSGDLAVNWKIVLLKDGKPVQSRVITADNRGTDIRFTVPTGEARYTVQAEYEYQVRDTRTGEVVTKLRVFEDPAGGAVLTRNPTK